LLFAALVGCRPAPQTNTIIDKAESPDGTSLAILVDRSYHMARVSDEYFLIVIPASRDVNEAIRTAHIGDSAALVATWASQLRLRWQSDDVLVVVCKSCGLEAIDVIKKLDHIGSVKVIYEGLPEHTAFD
jgi:hypothetical protein